MVWCAKSLRAITLSPRTPLFEVLLPSGDALRRTATSSPKMGATAHFMTGRIRRTMAAMASHTVAATTRRERMAACRAAWSTVVVSA
jgi:hypothetical protein